MPDCNKCIWSTRDGRCVSWECDFISHEDARRIDWLSELAERRKAPEIVHCGECVNFSERDFCKVAGHNVHRKSNCMKVFGAERRTDD